MARLAQTADLPAVQIEILSTVKSFVERDMLPYVVQSGSARPRHGIAAVGRHREGEQSNSWLTEFVTQRFIGH